MTITPPPVTVTSVSLTAFPGLTVTTTVSLDLGIEKRLEMSSRSGPDFARVHAIDRRGSHPQAVYCAVSPDRNFKAGAPTNYRMC